jgi:hypothetical protein
MRMPTRNSVFSLAACLCAGAFLAGCLSSSEETAGVDEFPNSIYARVNEYLDEGKKSESINPVSGMADSLLGGNSFEVGSSATQTLPAIAAASESAAGNRALRGLAKSAAASACDGPVVAIDSTSESHQATVVHSASICWDEKALDAIKGNETIIRWGSVKTYPAGRIETTGLSDADGDGVLTPVPGVESRAELLMSAADGGILEKTVIVLGPGPDGDFGTEADNLIYSAAWTKTDGADTLARAVYADADSDGVVIDNARESLVDLDFYQKGPAQDRPDALWTRARMRMLVRFQVEAKVVSRLRFEAALAGGGRETGQILGRGGDEGFDMADTVLARFTSLAAPAAGAADTTGLVDTTITEITMTLGEDFDSKQDDSVYAIDIRSVRRTGEERQAVFRFHSEEPIPSGQDPRAGELSMEIEYADGTRVEAEGEISAGGMDLTIRDRQGRRIRAAWDDKGKQRLLERLD